MVHSVSISNFTKRGEIGECNKALKIGEASMSK